MAKKRMVLLKNGQRVHVPTRPCFIPGPPGTRSTFGACVNHPDWWAKIVWNNVPYCCQCFVDKYGM